MRDISPNPGGAGLRFGRITRHSSILRFAGFPCGGAVAGIPARASNVTILGSATIRQEASQAMPSNWHLTHKNELARAMVAQTKHAFLGIARGDARKEPTVKILGDTDMDRFFVKGETYYLVPRVR
jgi:hypothetical protein